MKPILVLLMAMFLFGACSGAEEFEDAESVVAAMTEEDIECENLETTDEFSDENVVISERGICTIDDKPVVISMFDNDKDKADFVALGRLLKPLAVGPNWVVSSDSEEAIERIAEALGATVPEPTPT